MSQIVSSKNGYAKHAICLLFIKLLYVYLNILMLPEEWTKFDFDRNIHIANILYEFIPFIIGIVILLKYLKPGHPISFVAIVFFCMYFIPSNSGLSLSDYDMGYYICINTFDILLLYFLGKIVWNKDVISVENQFESFSSDSNVRLQRTLRYLSLTTCLGVVAYVYFLSGSISLSGVFSEDIYDRRAALAEFYVQNTDGAIAYLMTIWGAIYASMLLIGLYLSLKNKHYVDVVIFVFTYLVLFSLLTEKSVLFKPIIAVFIYILYRSKKIQKAEYLFILGYLFLCVISLIEYYIENESVVYTLVLRRMTYMPQYLSHAYYEFFNTHDKVWLTRDFFQLEKLVRMVYHGSYEHGAVTVISENCFPGIPSPNTGLFAESFLQMGYLGIIVFPAIYAYIFKVYYKASLLFGEGAPQVLLVGFFLSLINIQLLAPRGILVVLVFLLICYWVRRQVNISK